MFILIYVSSSFWYHWYYPSGELTSSTHLFSSFLVSSSITFQYYLRKNTEHELHVSLQPFTVCLFVFCFEQFCGFLRLNAFNAHFLFCMCKVLPMFFMLFYWSQYIIITLSVCYGHVPESCYSVQSLINCSHLLKGAPKELATKGSGLPFFASHTLLAEKMRNTPRTFHANTFPCTSILAN